MQFSFSRIIEVTFVLIVLYLILDNSFGFAQIIRTSGEVYANSIKALQGRADK